MTRTLVNILASTVDAYHRCVKTGNDYATKHAEMLDSLVIDYMPRGSGFDSGTTLHVADSTGEKLVFTTSFHHMNEQGYYDGWTEHTVTVRPSFIYGFTLTISGRDRNDIKENIHEVFDVALRQFLIPDHANATYKLAT